MRYFRMKKLVYIAGLLLCFVLCFSFAGCGSKDWTNDSYDNGNRSHQIVQGDMKDSEQDKEENKDSIDDGKEQTKGNSKKKSDNSDKPDSDKNTREDSQENKKNSVNRFAKENSKSKKASNQKKKQAATKSTDTSSTTKESSRVGDKYVRESDGTDTKQDEYHTDPVPEGQQNPVEPQDVIVDNTVAGTCSLVIECSTILDNMKKLKKGKESIVPKDGIIYHKNDVTFYEGESVADVLKRETKNNSIHLEFMNTPGFNSDYIEGIGNLYEFDCGPLSGWSYCVDSWFPNYGCSRYIVTQGAQIEWHYTCNMGKDVSAGTGIK